MASGGLETSECIGASSATNSQTAITTHHQRDDRCTTRRNFDFASSLRMLVLLVLPTVQCYATIAALRVQSFCTSWQIQSLNHAHQLQNKRARTCANEAALHSPLHT